MSKRSSSPSSARSWTTFIAFVSIVLFTIAWALAMLFEQLGWNSGLIGFIRTGASILMSVVVLVVAYNYVRYKGTGMKVLYWICAVVVIALQVILLSNFNLF